MATTNQYETMSAITALNIARAGNLLLPDIQREYVWNVNEIEALFESITDNYPIGSCIFWKTNRTIINKEKPNLYYFLRTFQTDAAKNEKVPEVLVDEADYYIVLDGQQRITSLNIALFGSYTYYKGGKGHLRTNPKSWVTKELYYNLDYYKTNDGDDEHPRKRFCFLTNKEVETGNYFKVKILLGYKNLQEFIKYMLNAGFRRRSQSRQTILFFVKISP